MHIFSHTLCFSFHPTPQVNPTQTSTSWRTAHHKLCHRFCACQRSFNSISSPTSTSTPPPMISFHSPVSASPAAISTTSSQPPIWTTLPFSASSPPPSPADTIFSHAAIVSDSVTSFNSHSTYCFFSEPQTRSRGLLGTVWTAASRRESADTGRAKLSAQQIDTWCYARVARLSMRSLI
jgi:hypothetical protein